MKELFLFSSGGQLGGGFGCRGHGRAKLSQLVLKTLEKETRPMLNDLNPDPRIPY